MSGPQRYAPAVVGVLGLGEVAALHPDHTGSVVLYADVEEALRDSAALAWLMPVFEGRDDDPEVAHRAGALAMGLQMGLSGRALVAQAMEACGS